MECLILQPESLIVVGHLAGRMWQYLHRRFLRHAQVRNDQKFANGLFEISEIRKGYNPL
jgi:hypothetical protein